MCFRNCHLSCSHAISAKRIILSLWFTLAVLTATVSVAGEPGAEWITFVSHRSGRNLLYKMRPDGSELSVIFGGELKGMPGVPEGLTLYREPHWGRVEP